MVSKQDKLEKAGQVLDGIQSFFKKRAASYASATKIEDIIKINLSELPPHIRRSTPGHAQGFSMNYSDHDGTVHERYIFNTQIIDFNKLKEKLKGKLDGKTYKESLDAFTFEELDFGKTEVKSDTVEVAKKMGSDGQTKIDIFELFETLAESLITPQELAKQIDEKEKADSYEQNRKDEGNGPQETDKGVPTDNET